MAAKPKPWIVDFICCLNNRYRPANLFENLGVLGFPTMARAHCCGGKIYEKNRRPVLVHEIF
jgi:hypothetical protein